MTTPTTVQAPWSAEAIDARLEKAYFLARETWIETFTLTNQCDDARMQELERDAWRVVEDLRDVMKGRE